MIGGNEADDKINRRAGSTPSTVTCATSTSARLPWSSACATISTYKDAPGARRSETEITHIYGRAEAHEVIERSQADYTAKFGPLKGLFETAALALSTWLSRTTPRAGMPRRETPQHPRVIPMACGGEPEKVVK